MTTPRVIHLAASLLLAGTSLAAAASYGELTDGVTNGGATYPVPAGPYAMSPTSPACPQCLPGQMPYQGPPMMPSNAEGTPPMALDAPGAAMLPPPASPNPYLPIAPQGSGPHGRQQLWTFGQVNSTTDPFNPWGLSTPFMFVPWSTPLSGWTNAQTWNWWRERSGALPRNW